jgi:hypothetical protein
MSVMCGAQEYSYPPGVLGTLTRSQMHLQLSPTVCPNASDVENMRTSEFPQRPVLMEVSDATIHLTGR